MSKLERRVGIRVFSIIDEIIFQIDIEIMTFRLFIQYFVELENNLQFLKSEALKRYAVRTSINMPIFF